MLEPAVEGVPVLSEGHVLWIAYEGDTVFAAGTSAPLDSDTAIILTAGGTRHREWAEQGQAAVSAWAAMNGASKLIMHGRKGWARSLRAFGWAAVRTDENGDTVFEKDLTGEQQEIV